MSLRESPFPNAFVEGLHAIGWGLIFPCFWFLDRLIAGCISISLERRLRREAECYLHPLKVVFGSALFLVLFVISTPFALLGFMLWAPLQAARRPFSYREHVPTVAMENRNARWEETGKLSFGFVTANLCLLPDGIARFNNLGQTQRRAAVIGHIIVQGVTRPHICIFVDSPSSCGTLTPSSSLLPQAAPSSYGAVESVAVGQTEGVEPDGDVASVTSSDDPGGLKQHPQPSLPNCNQNSIQQAHPPRALRTLLNDSDVSMEVSSLFPSSVDVVCLQEVFDKRAALKLMRTLGPLYGHVIYDVGVYACYPVGTCSSFKFFNSGLFLASRYPVMEAQFRCFPNGCGEDALAAKGLLCVKVDIGLQKGEKRMVGYINCTHLHAPEGDGEIRFEQLNMLTKWISEFQTMTKRDNEMVMFDVLCGDFNFDNCSPDDRLEQSHSVFEEYRDPCRAGAGQEKPWVIGTLLEQPTLYHEDVATLENLQRTLENEEQRRHFISPPVPLRGVPLDYPEPGQPWVGRRIDYLLYRETSASSHCTTEVEEFTYVTQLAGLTDHIPVSFRLNVTLDSEEM